MIRRGRRQNNGDDARRRGKGRGLCTYDLQFDCLAFELNSANLEVDANCGDVAFRIGIICKTEEEAGLEARNGELLCSKRNWSVSRYLSDARITDEKEFEEVVVFAGVHVGK